MLENLFKNTKVTAQALDASWLRNDAIAQNIANVDTPGYKRNTVKFEEYLSDALDTNSLKGNLTNRRHIPIGNTNTDNIPIQVTKDNKTLSYRLDGNNVDIENEMALMAKNTIQYNTLTQRISQQFKDLLSAIKEGR